MKILLFSQTIYFLKKDSNNLFSMTIIIIGGLSFFLFKNLKIFQGNTIFLTFPITNRAADFNILFIFDWIRTYFFLSVLLIGAAVNMFSYYYIQESNSYLRFHLILLSFIISMILLIFSPNILRIIIGWDGLGITSYLLVAYYQNNKSINASHLTIFSNRVGDILIIAAIALIFSNRVISLFTIKRIFNNKIIIFIIAFAAFTKRAQLPFSAWLPAAMAAPTPVSSLVHSSTLVTAGVYLLIRFLPIVSSLFCEHYIAIVGISTIIIAGIAAIFCNDMKKLVAYSTLSHLSLIVLSIFLIDQEVTIAHLLIHAYFKALLFIAVGVLIHQREDYQEFSILKFNSFYSNSLLFLSLIRTLALLGFPFISAFFSKDTIFEKIIIIDFSCFIIIAILSSIFFSIIYAWKLLRLQWTLFDSKFALHSYHKLAPQAIWGIFLLWPLALTSGRIINWSILSPTTSWEFSLSTEIKLFLTLSFLILGLLALLISTKKIPPSYWWWTLKSPWGLEPISAPILTKSSLYLAKLTFKISERFWTSRIYLYLFRNFSAFFITKEKKRTLSFLIFLLTLILISI